MFPQQVFSEERKSTLNQITSKLQQNGKLTTWKMTNWHELTLFPDGFFNSNQIRGEVNTILKDKWLGLAIRTAELFFNIESIELFEVIVFLILIQHLKYKFDSI